MPNRPQKVTKSRRSALKIESLEARQLLAGVTGAGTEVGTDIKHPNGNIYDQVLMTGSSVTVTADPGQVTRVSFLDASGDIVQAEFAGAGSLTVSLAGATGPVAPDADKYNQSVQYMKGTATFTIQGSDATTNFGVFSVGTATANAGAANPIFTDASGKAITGGNHIADVQRITVVADPSKPNGSTFGGIRAGNAVFSGSSGVVGISAAGVQVQDTVIIGDIDASSTAIPTLIFGTNSQFGQVIVSGGDLLQTNGASISNTGSYAYQVALTAGTNSGGTALPAQTQNSTVNFTGSNPFNLVNNTFNLTTAPDTIPGMAGTNGTGNSGNDTINGTLNDSGSTTTAATFTALDNIDGGTGTDTFNILDLDDTGGSAMPAGTTVKNVEIVNARGADVVTLDTTTWTGVTSLNVTQAKSAVLTAPSTTAITVAGVTGAVTVTGGSTQSITSTQAGSAISSNGGTTVSITSTGNTGGTITVGGTTAPTGAVTVSSTGKNPADITGATKESFVATLGAEAQGATIIFGGTTVTLVDTNASGSVTADEVVAQLNAATYSNWTTSAPTATTLTFTAKIAGNIADVTPASFTGTHASAEGVAITQGTPSAMGAITVTGGTIDSVTQSVGTKVTTLTPGVTIPEGAITVTGGTSTTSISVTEDPSKTAVNAVTAVSATNEVTTVTFSDLTAGSTAVVGGLTFTNTSGATIPAATLATYFANLVPTSVGTVGTAAVVTGASNGSAPTSAGTYSGNLVKEFGSGAASGATVTFTSIAAGTVADITFGGTGTNPTGSTVQGTAKVSAVTGVIGVIAGKVAIDDTGTEADTLTTVSVSGWGKGSTVASDVLSTVTLANSTDDITLSTAATSTTLGLTLNGVGTSSSTATVPGTIGTGATYTTVNLTGTGAASYANLTAGGATALNVNGSQAIDLSGSGTGLNTVKTVVVSDTAGLSLPAGLGGQATFTALTSTSTGAITATVNAANTVVSTGAGADVITINAAAPAKNITLGAGDDNLKLGAGTTSATGILDGGDGTDTLTFAAPTDAATASGSALFEAQFQNFEKIGLGISPAAAANATVDLHNLDDINYVTSAGSTAAVAGVAGATEQWTITFGTTDADATLTGTAGATLSFDGVTVTGDANPTTAELITAMSTTAYPDWTPSGATATTLTFTSKTANTSVTDITAANFGGTAVTTGKLAATPAVVTQGVTTVAAVTAGGTLQLDHMQPNGTVELTAAQVATKVTALTNDTTADAFNIVTKNAGTVGFGQVELTGAETVKWTATDTSTSTIDTHTLDIKDAAATSITITGNANATLTPDAANVVLASIDGSAMTGKLVASGGGTVATTVKGGAAADTLTAAFTGDTLNGGGGDDTLIVNGKSLVQLTGGAGNDTFNVSGATSNVTSFATITDLAAGDMIKFAVAGTPAFKSVAVQLDPTTAVFQNFADEVIKTTAQGTVGWFNFGGSTYVIEHVQAGGTAFLNGTDVVVKLGSPRDLSTASFSTSNATLLIV